MSKNYFGFKFPYWGKFNNAEYGALVGNIKNLAIATGASALKCREELLQSITRKNDILVEMVNTAKASVLTADIADKDVVVNQLVAYIFSMVKAQQNSPIKQVAQSAARVLVAITPYKDAQYKAYQQQNQLLKGMLHDLGKLAEDVVEIQLGSAVENLTLAIAQMEVVIGQRNEEQMANDLGAVKDHRTEMDMLLEELFQGVIAHNHITPSEDLASFLANVNKLVADAEAVLAHRLSKKDESDQDSDQDSDQEEPTETE